MTEKNRQVLPPGLSESVRARLNTSQSSAQSTEGGKIAAARGLEELRARQASSGIVQETVEVFTPTGTQDETGIDETTVEKKQVTRPETVRERGLKAKAVLESVARYERAMGRGRVPPVPVRPEPPTVPQEIPNQPKLPSGQTPKPTGWARFNPFKRRP